MLMRRHDVVVGRKLLRRHMSAGVYFFYKYQISKMNIELCNFDLADSFYYPPTKSEGYSFGGVRASIRNHISVPIGQI